jgi:hypothetical protein
MVVPSPPEITGCCDLTRIASVCSVPKLLEETLNEA